MLEANIIRTSTSSFALPVTIVQKENGTFRVRTDYRLVNQQTGLFSFPMPCTEAIIVDSGVCQMLSRIDI